MVYVINKVSYSDGKRKRSISEGHLRDIRSRVMTHEGEVLRGSAGETYQKKYAATYKGKKLA